jgi:hypothetical protein
MKKRTLKKMPTTGQFVMLNTYKGEIWSTNYRWEDGEFQELIADEWVSVPKPQFTHAVEIEYIVKDV